MILLLGGSGLLGTELQKYIKVHAPSHKKFDILEPRKLRNIDLIIHVAAYTAVARAEKEKVECFKTNFFGTLRLIETFPDIPFVYISTEYIYNPVNFYSLSKLKADELVQTKAKHHLIIRTLFKPTPFPHEKAFINQYTKGDYIDVITPLIVAEIYKWDRKSKKIVDVGTERKSMYQLAIRTKPNIEKCSVDDVKEVKLPKDYK